MENIPDEMEGMEGLSLKEVPVPVPVMVTVTVLITVPIPLPIPLPISIVAAANPDGVKYRYNEQPDVLMDSMKDSIVSKSTLACYLAKIFSVLGWLKEHHPTVLTTHGYFCIQTYQDESPGLNMKVLFQKYKTQFNGELQNARITPLFFEELSLPICIWNT
jgi:hypothetical protein